MCGSGAVAVRFAPSPTGLLHVGNARTALVNWLFARRHGGTFSLRLDDTDVERSRPEFARAIEEDLRWLGLAWDGFARQSDRLADYEGAAARLRAARQLYPCYETAEELEVRRKLQLARRQPPVYDRAALKLSEAERARLEGEGRRPHWRFLLQHRAEAWDDAVHGPMRIDTASLSDPVLVRADGRFLYTLTSVVDDAAHGVTHVIRGEDHITNTAVQLQLFEALGHVAPAFAHLALLTGAGGEELSKRLGALSLADLRENGIEPMTLNSLLARLGTADPVEPQASLEELVAGFDLARFGRAAAKFDRTELEHLNARLLHALPFAAVRERLPPGADEAFWLAVRGNLARLTDAAEWLRVVRGPLAPVLEDAEFAAAAARLLPPEPYDAVTWGAWTKAASAATGRKGRALFHPLRLALTARERGPDMQSLLPLIGRARAAARLRGETA